MEIGYLVTMTALTGGSLGAFKEIVSMKKKQNHYRKMNLERNKETEEFNKIIENQKRIRKNIEEFNNYIKNNPEEVRAFFKEKIPEAFEISYDPELKVFGSAYNVALERYNPEKKEVENFEKIKKVENKWEVRNLIKEGYLRV